LAQQFCTWWCLWKLVCKGHGFGPAFLPQDVCQGGWWKAQHNLGWLVKGTTQFRLVKGTTQFNNTLLLIGVDSSIGLGGGLILLSSLSPVCNPNFSFLWVRLEQKKKSKWLKLGCKKFFFCRSHYGAPWSFFFFSLRVYISPRKC